MKIFLTFCLVILSCVNAFSQKANQQKADTNEIYTIVKTQPKFPGDINKYLSDSIRYPDEAKDANKQGTVYLQFVVEKDGSVSTVKVLRGVCPSLDNESIRVISAMPRWTPGMQDGHKVRVLFCVPIHYILKDTYSIPPPPPRQPVLQNPFK